MLEYQLYKRIIVGVFYDFPMTSTHIMGDSSLGYDPTLPLPVLHPACLPERLTEECLTRLRHPNRHSDRLLCR